MGIKHQITYHISGAVTVEPSVMGENGNEEIFVIPTVCCGAMQICFYCSILLSCNDMCVCVCVCVSVRECMCVCAHACMCSNLK